MSAIVHNRWIRIQLVTLIFFLLSQIDKANIAVAFPGIRADLGITPTALGFAVGMFAWGYMLLQIPVGRLTSAWSAKYTLLLLGIAWALITASTALVHSETALIINRFALGLSEGGILPGVVVMIRAWFTPRERGPCQLGPFGHHHRRRNRKRRLRLARRDARLAPYARCHGGRLLVLVRCLVARGR